MIHAGLPQLREPGRVFAALEAGRPPAGSVGRVVKLLDLFEWTVGAGHPAGLRQHYEDDPAVLTELAGLAHAGRPLDPEAADVVAWLVWRVSHGEPLDATYRFHGSAIRSWIAGMVGRWPGERPVPRRPPTDPGTVRLVREEELPTFLEVLGCDVRGSVGLIRVRPGVTWPHDVNAVRAVFEGVPTHDAIRGALRMDPDVIVLEHPDGQDELILKCLLTGVCVAVERSTPDLEKAVRALELPVVSRDGGG